MGLLFRLTGELSGDWSVVHGAVFRGTTAVGRVRRVVRLQGGRHLEDAYVQMGGDLSTHVHGVSQEVNGAVHLQHMGAQ